MHRLRLLRETTRLFFSVPTQSFWPAKKENQVVNDTPPSSTLPQLFSSAFIGARTETAQEKSLQLFGSGCIQAVGDHQGT